GDLRAAPTVYGATSSAMDPFHALWAIVPAKRQRARKRVISALIQQANLLPVEPLFFDLKISAQEKLRRKLLHSEAYGFRGNLESLVLNAPSSALVASGWIEFRLGCVIKCHCINPLIDASARTCLLESLARETVHATF